MADNVWSTPLGGNCKPVDVKQCPFLNMNWSWSNNVAKWEMVSDDGSKRAVCESLPVLMGSGVAITYINFVRYTSCVSSSYVICLCSTPVSWIVIVIPGEVELAQDFDFSGPLSWVRYEMNRSSKFGSIHSWR